MSFLHPTAHGMCLLHSIRKDIVLLLGAVVSIVPRSESSDMGPKSTES
jgi:hypothetical protein